MESKFEIGEKIKNKRLQLNLRMDDVAKEVGVTRSTLWSIENGNGNYTIDTLLKLLNFLTFSFIVSISLILFSIFIHSLIKKLVLLLLFSLFIIL